MIGTHISSCRGACDRGFENYEEDIISLSEKRFPVLGDGADIEREILEAAREGDSVGGVLETAVINMPAGVVRYY